MLSHNEQVKVGIGLQPVKSKNAAKLIKFGSLFLIATGLTDDCDVQQGDDKLLADCNAVGGSAKICV